MAVTTGMGQKKLSPYKPAKTRTGREGGTDVGDVTRETFGGKQSQRNQKRNQRAW